jgi:hypothetical protein
MKKDRRFIFLIRTIKKTTNAISIRKVRKEENPNKLKKIKMTEDSPIPIGKERLIRKGTLIDFACLKIIKWQDKKPSASAINIETISII